MSSFPKNVFSDLLDGNHLEYRLPGAAKPASVIILLHGWTGDEKSMWVFASSLPDDCLLVAPRGIYNSSLGGFGWFKDEVGQWPDLDDFEGSFLALDKLVQSKLIQDYWDRKGIHLVGFSQGAALAYGYAIQSSTRIRSIAGLSGFVPNGVQEFIYKKPLSGIPVFVTNGVQDKIVPIERARNGVSILQELGAKVSYCEEDAGHRLSPICFRGLQTFFDHINLEIL